MNRWKWLRGLVVALILAGQALLLPQVGSAELAQVGPGRYMAGILRDEFEFMAAPESMGRQRASNWCWAAAIQMALNYHGLYVTQEEVVNRIYGRLVDQPGGPEEILTALSGWAPDAAGGYSAIKAEPTALTGNALIGDLANRRPLIVGLEGNPVGHAYVLTAVTYGVDQQNNPVLQSVVLRDPWPTNPSREVMSWKEFTARTIFAARVRVVPV